MAGARRAVAADCQDCRLGRPGVGWLNLTTLAGLLLHTVVAKRVEALTLCDKAAIERVDGQPTGHAHDLGGIALPVGLGRHEPRLISGGAPLSLPGLGTDAMKVKLPFIMELGYAHHDDRKLHFHGVCAEAWQRERG